MINHVMYFGLRLKLVISSKIEKTEELIAGYQEAKIH